MKYTLRPSDHDFLLVFIRETGIALGPTGTGTSNQLFVVPVLLILVCLQHLM